MATESRVKEDAARRLDVSEETNMAGLDTARTLHRLPDPGCSESSGETGLTLTIRQGLILRFMVSYLEQHGSPPTLDEIACAMGTTKVTVWVWGHLHKMEEDGIVSVRRYRSRGVVPRSHCPTCGRAWAFDAPRPASDVDQVRTLKVVPEL